MSIDFEKIELDPDAARQYIDARSAFMELERAEAAASQVRGGMVWVKANGAEYLARTTPTGKQTGLGRRGPETEQVHAAFHTRKSEAEQRVSALRQTVVKHERMNRALRVGRMPDIAVKILQRLKSAGLLDHFRIVGTHALYAYETAAGVRIPGDITTTLDIDLLWDTRKRVEFAQRLDQDAGSMLEVIRKVDKTFQIADDQKYTATNANGFQVDILRREAVGDDPHPIRLSADEDDFWVVQAKRAGDLMNAPSFSEVVVAANGGMARMNTLHPLAFAEFKRWMARQPDRDARKRQRDLLQAEAVEAMVQERLPQLAG
jgi:hypothetical protein